MHNPLNTMPSKNIIRMHVAVCIFSLNLINWIIAVAVEWTLRVGSQQRRTHPQITKKTFNWTWNDW